MRQGMRPGLLFVALAAALVAGSASGVEAPEPKAEDAAEASATAWLAMVDSGHYGESWREAARRLARYRESAAARANAALEQVVERLSRGGYEPRRCGIVEGSGRRGVSLETTLASHALIHTADGNHFRDVLADAGARCGLEVCRVTERELLARAAAALRKGPEELQGRVLALGRSAGPPWAADQKKASLVAWLLLTEHDAGRGSG